MLVLREKLLRWMRYLNSPLENIWEAMHLISPRLVATCDYTELWYDEANNTVSEIITFYLMQYPSGSRDYKFHAYGQSAERDMHENHLRDILIWVYGGPLPSTAKTVGTHATIIELVKGQQERS